MPTMKATAILEDLASEGESLCMSGDCVNGIKKFEAAVQLY